MWSRKYLLGIHLAISKHHWIKKPKINLPNKEPIHPSNLDITPTIDWLRKFYNSDWSRNISSKLTVR